MPNLNRIQIIGRVGKDPEERFTKNGTGYIVFSVAVNHVWKDREGEAHKETDWFNVEAWGRLAEVCKKFVTKGRLVYLEGPMRTSRYEHEGETRYFTKVVAGRLQMLDRPPKAVDEPDEELAENQEEYEEGEES